MKNSTLLLSLLITVTTGFTSLCHAQQPGWTIDLLGKEKKPEKFEERKLGSERMAEKKFTIVRRFFQNNYTRYNYFFNANNKINAVLERAKENQADDFTKLLPYFPYSLENTAAQKTELDSVIYKATAGILLHDLRNDWIDNMYLLMGKAYFLRKDFDSAAATFQFINYNLFPRKKDEDDSRVVGTNENEEATGSTISIANKEKQNFVQKIVSKPPSRNDALIWLALTLTEQGEMGEAAGLINTLQNDPNLPKRLKDDLNDVNAYWFYKENNYDSAAAYLERALSNSENKHDLARSEFLLAQLYEFTGNFDKASLYYNKSSAHTTNALMDIHAQLNNAKMRKGNNEKELQLGIDNLTRLSKKDKFENYRDIIFYSAGDLAMQKPDTTEAIGYFNKCIKLANEGSVSYKNKAFVRLGDIAFNRKEYKQAYIFYDSLQSGDTSLNDRMEELIARKNSLSEIVQKIVILEREDSLQRIAALPAVERDAFVKKLSKKLRKERGIKEEDNSGATDLITFDSQKSEPVDLFASSTKNGDWYFYNSSLKSKGFGEFKRKWGTRTNTDNWRRKSAAVTAALNNNSVPDMASSNPDGPDADAAAVADPSNSGNKVSKADPSTGTSPQSEDISYEGLMSNLPISPERLDASNNLIAVNLFELGKLYQNKLEDYRQAITTYDSSLKRFPDSLYDGELYLGLFYCYSKLGNNEKAAYYKNLTSSKFANSHAAKILTNPAAAHPDQKNPEGTKRYENIYTLFIEGKFDEALAEKKKADSMYGTNYWSPQLLYIEAVYHVKQKEDSAAISVLDTIASLYPNSPLVPKAQRMIDVLGRRKEIEEYLTKLNITRYPEDTIVIKEERQKLVRNDSNLIVSPKLYDSVKAITAAPVTPPVIKDTVVKAAPVVSGPYVFNAAAVHNVVMLLDKVDATYVNESKNAFARYVSDNYRGVDIKVAKEVLDKDLSLVVFTSFTNAEEAMAFLKKLTKAAPDEVSWLPANKYSFVLIDNDNLERLRITKDVNGYRNLLKKQYPEQFK
ncbi:MAG: tetratricopeptide repeat protein [Ferruginibacter sp.]